MANATFEVASAEAASAAHASGDDAADGAVSVGVAIVHRNQGSRCQATITQFRDQGVAVRIVVADNDSDPAERALVAKTGVEIVDAGANTGYGPGLNVATRRLLQDPAIEWIVLSPHDALLESGGIARLIALANAQPHAGIVCADVGDQATPMVDHVLGALPGPAHVHAGWEDAHYPHGTLIVARRHCLDEIGLFDERYFAYNDEADLGLRARAAGWEVGLARGVMVENPTTSTPAAVIDYLRLRNTILLIRTHFGWGNSLTRAVIAVGNVVHCTVRPSARPPWFNARARLYGVRDALLGRWGAPPPGRFD